MVSHKKEPYPQHSNSGSEGVSQSRAPPWRERGLGPISRILATGICIRETSPQNIWLWKPMRFLSGWPKGMERTEVLLLKGLHVDSLTPGANENVAVWIAPGLYVKEIYLLIFVSARGQGGLLRPSLGKKASQGITFAFSLYPDIASRHAALHLPMAWQEPVDTR